jgi:NAD(P)-dependent dehydrogenase (short-subunit alcohol dehydrogenase family)
VVDLSGKTILLTGASSGIGAATAGVLGDAGAFLVAHYAGDAEGVERATARLAPGNKLVVHADFTQPGSGRRLWREAVAWRGRIDVLVNNAAIMPETPIDGDDNQWDAGWAGALQVNVVEPANLMREAVRHYQAAGGGILVTMSSWVAQQGSAIPQLSAYAATKAAIKATTQTLARAHAKDGVLAYVIAPGIVNTRLSKISAATRGGEDAVRAILPLREMVPPEEVADLVALVSSGLYRHLSGATLDVNGAAYIR